MIPDSTTAQSLAGSSKSLKTAVSRASTPRAERNDRAPVDAAASSRSYINAICDVLDRYPDGAGKEQVMKEVMERRAEWWPDKQDDTVRRGLAVAFSTEPKSKAPRIWEYERLYDGTNRRENIWKRTGAPHHHQPYSTSFDPRSSAPLHHPSEKSTAAHARTQNLALTPQTPSKTPDNIEPTLQLSTGDVQHATHLWRPAHQSIAEDAANVARPSAALDTHCRNESPADDAHEVDISNGNSMSVAVRSDSHATPAAPETVTAIPDLQSDLQRSLPPTNSEDLSPNLQVLHWGRQVRWRKELVPQLDEMRGKRSTFSDEAKRLHQRKEEWPTRIAALEQQLQEAREHADNASGEYEKVQAEAAEVAALVEKMEKEIQGIDADMLQ